MREVAEIARARDDGRARCVGTKYYCKGWYKVGAGVECRVCTRCVGGLVTKDCWLWSRKSRNRGVSRWVVGVGRLRERSGVLGWQAAGA